MVDDRINRESYGIAGRSTQVVGPPYGAFDFSAALARMRGDRTLLAALIAIFLEDGPLLMERIRHAYAEPNRAELNRAAHSLRGLASNFDARDVTQSALEIERLTAADDELDPAVGAAIEHLHEAFTNLTEGLRQFCP
jgi:HPt (histidine-containing phosphotransfer) domain-containing protein